MRAPTRSRFGRRSRAALFVFGCVVLSLTAGGWVSSSKQSQSTPTATKSSTASGPIKIGAAISLTGDEAPFDVPPIDAFKLAVKQVNASGGILGRKIQLSVRDMKSDASLAGRVAGDFIQQGVDLLIVPCDPDLGAPGAIAGQAAGVLTFSECEASSRFGPQGIGDLVYTPSHITYLEGYVMAEWAKMKKHLNRAFVIKDTTFAGYDGEVCAGFNTRMTAIAGKKSIVGTDTLSTNDQSIAATITRIKSAHPSFIYMCSQPPASPGWIRQIRAAGIKLPILLATATDGKYWLKAVPNASNIYYPVPTDVYGDDPSSRVNAFVKNYTKQVGQPPVNTYALFGAAIMDLYKKAVIAAGTTSAQAVHAKLDTFRNVPTIVGATTYTKTAHIALNRPMEILQIQHGKISYLETWKVRKSPGLKG